MVKKIDGKKCKKVIDLAFKKEEKKQQKRLKAIQKIIKYAKSLDW